MDPIALKVDSNSQIPSHSSTPAIYLLPKMAVNRVGVLTVGTIGNSVVGALTGLLGSLIWQHDGRVLVAIMLIGCLSGGTGGLLHALVTINARKNADSTPADGENTEFGRVCRRVFSQAPCWSVIGASIGFLSARNFTSDVSFPIVIFTALAGTLAFAIYATVMCRITGSYLHLLILQNQVLVLAERTNLWIDAPSQSPKPYHHLMPEFESSPTRAKQIVIEIKDEN